METVQFKSIPEIWKKEFLGIKPNTVRVFADIGDRRKQLLDEYATGNLNLLTIAIKNTNTKEIFYRDVKDVTKFEDYYIISWFGEYGS